MDTADNRSYGLPRRGHERLFNGERRPSGTSFDNLTFYEEEGPEGRGGGGDWPAKSSSKPWKSSTRAHPLFFSSFDRHPLLPVLQTVDYVIEILSAGIFLRMLYRFTISTLNTTFHVDGLYKDHSFSLLSLRHLFFIGLLIFIGILFLLPRIDNSLFFPPF